LRRAIRKNNPLYLITDTGIAGISHIEIARRAIDAGIRTIQLRDKYLSKKDLYKVADRIAKMSVRHKVTFIINDHIDIALAVNTDGVHLGQEDMPLEEARRLMGKGKIIGISTHTVHQAIQAKESGADYIGFGPMFPTVTKNAGNPQGVEKLREIRRHVDIPIVAIGGITWENVHEVMKAGADAVAAVSGLLTGNIKANVGYFMKALLKGV
jgi:thiamine-phosphate pyrophosphorylase